MSSTNEFSSWKVMIQSIDEDRRKLPWDKTSISPVIRVNRSERLLKERQLNPVTMQFIDPLKETNYQTTKSNLIQTKSLTTLTLIKNKHNIITNEGPSRKIKLHDKSYRNRDYDFISNLDFNDFSKATTIPDDKLLQLARPKTINYPIRGKHREFNLINNIYKENHEEKIIDEYIKTKDHILLKYNQTHDFHPLLGKYYDNHKDEQISNESTIRSTIKTSNQLDSLPPSFKLSEGKSYNIINNEVKNLDYLQKVSIHDIRRNNRIYRTKDKDVIVSQHNQEQTEKSMIQSLNRISYDRWKSEIDRGYNIITSLDGVHNPYPQRPSTVWNKATMNSLDINNNNSSHFIRPYTSISNNESKLLIPQLPLTLTDINTKSKLSVRTSGFGNTTSNTITSTN
mmetsp:Transcript_13742/g.12457  ORF Transcript_13742/g.12457 Transcript_13742/m.12457 type:complete len:397 (+) Transcript_13742:86-1276(+)